MTRASEHCGYRRPRTRRFSCEVANRQQQSGMVQDAIGKLHLTLPRSQHLRWVSRLLGSPRPSENNRLFIRKTESFEKGNQKAADSGETYIAC